MTRVSRVLRVALPWFALGGCQDESVAPTGPASPVPSFGKAPASPANPELAYGAASGNGYYLWVANADGSNATALVPYSGHQQPLPSWGPGGDGTVGAPYRLAFSSAGVCYTERVDVIIDAGTGSPVVSRRVDLDAKFTTPAQSCDPDWSPHGDRIAFVNLAPEPDGTRSLWVVDELGTAPPTRLYTAPSGYGVKWPCWSPDALEIAFLERDLVHYPYPAAIKVLTLATGAVRTVLESGALPNLASPEWARKPETNALLFVASTGQSSSDEVWRLDLGTLQSTKVLLGREASWSPTDGRFAFTNWNSGKLSIYDFVTKKTTSLGIAGRTVDWRRP